MTAFEKHKRILDLAAKYGDLRSKMAGALHDGEPMEKLDALQIEATDVWCRFMGELQALALDACSQMAPRSSLTRDQLRTVYTTDVELAKQGAAARMLPEVLHG